MSGGHDNGWFQQNCDPSPDTTTTTTTVPSGGGPVNTDAAGNPAPKTATQVIENLVGQCYPSQAPQTIRNFIPDDDKRTDTDPLEWDLGFLYSSLIDLGIPVTGLPSKVKVTFPDGKDETSGKVCLNDPEDPNSEVNCDGNYEYEACIKEHLNCIFKPYAGGAWKPPQADCDTFVAEGQFGITNKVCVRNCVHPRVPIYQHEKNDNSNHTYTMTSDTPAGYSNTKVAWYGHQGETDKAIPVYVSYSSTNIDTMLTTDPAGEKSTMDAAGMGARDTVMFYAYRDPTEIIGALGEGEQGTPLYRYYNPITLDHRYTITPIGGAPINPNLDKGYYDLTEQVDADLLIEFNCARGSAGYKNTFGYYLTSGADMDPTFGEILLSNATDATGYRSFTIPAATLNQYAPCRLGFVLIPNGYQVNGSSAVAIGTDLAFTELNTGWTTIGLGSSQSNYSLFSESRLNPIVNGRHKRTTRWTSRWWQWWEDLVDGDDDYDDVKISYRLNYAGSNWYYEGIQCHVFKELVEPEYMELRGTNDCEDNWFTPRGFTDAALTRHECGRLEEGEFGCSKCVGEYSFKRNATQTVTAIRSGTISLRSHGGMTGGMGDCTVFTYEVLKNGTQIHIDSPAVQEWKSIGEKLHEFTVAKGDDITFRIVSIDQGHYNGSVAPAFSLRDEGTGAIFCQWAVRITTIAQNYSAAQQGQPVGSTGPCGIVGSFSLYDLTNASNTTSAWSTGGGLTNNILTVNSIPGAFGDDNDVDDDTSGVMVREIKNGLSVSIQYEVNPGLVQYKVLGVVDHGEGGYRTGQLLRYYVGTNKDTGEKFWQGLRIDTIDGTNCPTTGIVQSLSFQSILEDNELNEYGLPPAKVLMVAQGVQSSTYYDSHCSTLAEHLFTIDLKDTADSVESLRGEPCTLIQYWQRKTAAGEPVNFYHDVRLPKGLYSQNFVARFRAQLVYKPSLTNTPGVPESRVGYTFSWYLDSIVDYGIGYEDGQEYAFQFPDPQAGDSDGTMIETPYFPNNRLLPSKIRIKNAETGYVTRTAKWGIYEQSHNKNSTVWYSNMSRGKTDQFKTYNIIIDDSQ